VVSLPVERGLLLSSPVTLCFGSRTPWVVGSFFFESSALPLNPPLFGMSTPPCWRFGGTVSLYRRLGPSVTLSWCTFAAPTPWGGFLGGDLLLLRLQSLRTSPCLVSSKMLRAFRGTFPHLDPSKPF